MIETRRWEDLAIFGGVPAFTEPLHVGRPNIGNRQRLLERINDLLDRRWLSNNGPYVQQFEQRSVLALLPAQLVAKLGPGHLALKFGTGENGAQESVLIHQDVLVERHIGHADRLLIAQRQQLASAPSDVGGSAS